jgi:hypothetical protein
LIKLLEQIAAWSATASASCPTCGYIGKLECSWHGQLSSFARHLCSLSNHSFTLQANVSEHDLEELEESEAWIALQCDFAEWEAEQEALLQQ